MGERAQRTRVRIGPSVVEVALYKTSGDAPEAAHETRRVADDGTLIDPSAKAKAPDAEPDQALESQRATRSRRRPRLTTKPAEYRHGVTYDGKFIDLTEQLAAIDERNKLDVAEIDATVPNTTMPRLRIRDSYYVAPAEPDASPFLAHLWVGLRKTNSAAVLRWSKRTNQALGALVAQRADGLPDGSPILVLLELEWIAAMREPPPQCWLDDAVEEVSASGSEAVVEAMRELRRKPDVWDELRDERNGQRAELLEAARMGEKWTAPERVNTSVDLGDAILAAVR